MSGSKVPFTNEIRSGENKRAPVSRRTVIAGSLATAGVIALPWSADAAMSRSRSVAGAVTKLPRRSKTLARYLCSEVHERIAVELDATIADPSIDGEQTALALMEARCPGCGERVQPQHSKISAVIPKWRAVGNADLSSATKSAGGIA